MLHADVALPTLLAGPWEHVLVLSYGLDLPFYERAIAPELPSGCRNRILLGDERTYLASCDRLAATGLVRHANTRYVAEPILSRTRSHAKVILLACREAGRMLVGSGNLSLQGFGSGGELFTQYEYSEDSPGDLADFVAMRSLLERLRDRNSFTDSTGWRIDSLLEGAPWLFSAAEGESRIRHNLDASFIDQFVEAVGASGVDELVVFAPFFDEKLSALRSLVRRVRPERTTLLVQPGRTSIDPGALTKLQAATPGLEIRPTEREPEMPWLHAKLVVARLSDHAVCMQGSANLSVAAMANVYPSSNLEVVNLLRGERDDFDSVLETLTIGDAVPDPMILNLRHVSDSDDDRLSEVGWQLTSAEWAKGVLHVRYRGQLPDIAGLVAVVNGIGSPARVLKNAPGKLDLEVRTTDNERLGSGSPVRLCFADGAESNALFPCDRVALESALQASEFANEKLGRIGELDLDDDELERLIQELQAALVIDRRSIWQLVRGQDDGGGAQDDEELRLDYSDVDYELLRAHPKLRQYLYGGLGGVAGRSRLQIILNSITSAFSDLVNPPDTAALAAATAVLIAEGDRAREGNDDGDDEEETPRHRWSQRARVNLLLRNFIERFLRGLRSKDFQELVGPEVVSQNYLIFLHLLVRLGEKDWIDQDFLGDAIARTAALFWGTDSAEGYVRGLADVQRTEVLERLRKTHSDAQLLAALADYAATADPNRATALRTHLRDAWRGMLLHGVFPLSAEVVGEAHLMLTGGQPAAEGRGIVDELQRLADFRSRDEIAGALATRLGLRASACRFTRLPVHNARLNQDVNVEALVVEDESVELTADVARDTLEMWMAAESLPQYRVAVMTPDGRTTRYIAFYEPERAGGKYFARAAGERPVDLARLRIPPAPWDDAMLVLMAAAEVVATVAVQTSALLA
jgi:hypothetical protein